MSEEKLNEKLQEEEIEVPVDEELTAETPDEQSDVTDGVEEPRDLEKELAAAHGEIADLRDKMLRAAAENENFKKRMDRERLATLKYAGENIFREILPVVDNLERAVGQGVVDGVGAEKNLEALIEGVQLTLKSVMTTLEKFEVKPIESIGQIFDPKHQEALTMEVSENIPVNHVVNEFERGYYYKDRLLRAAKVTVSSGKSEPETAE